MLCYVSIQDSFMFSTGALSCNLLEDIFGALTAHGCGRCHPWYHLLHNTNNIITNHHQPE